MPPQVVAQQIEAAIRVVNDLVNAQNDLQGRSERQRMGTTLVMALVVPQRIKTPNGWIQVDLILRPIILSLLCRMKKGKA